MTVLKRPTRGLLFGSFLYNSEKQTQESLIELWQSQFGESIFFYHPHCPMKRFYSPEMGSEDVLRRFFLLSLEKVEREVLVPAKEWAINLEEKLSVDGRRTVNCDVGIITLENVQLATGKNFTHRVYLHNNIYSDLTLIAGSDGYRPLEWSYPDYSHPTLIQWFNWARKYLESY